MSVIQTAVMFARPYALELQTEKYAARAFPIFFHAEVGLLKTVISSRLLLSGYQFNETKKPRTTPLKIPNHAVYHYNEKVV